MKNQGLFLAIIFFCIQTFSPLSGTFLKAAETIKVDNIGSIKPVESRKQIDKNTEYISFVFNLPENPLTKAQYEKVYPYFGKEDYGFNMENYGHDGRTGFTF